MNKTQKKAIVQEEKRNTAREKKKRNKGYPYKNLEARSK